MAISLKFTNVTVTNVDESIPFYESLGFEVQNDVGYGSYRWVTLGSADQPGFSIVISEPSAGRSDADADALQELLTKGSLPLMVFQTDDVDALFEKLQATGAEVLQEPMEQDFGPRDCAFRDPSGNTIRIANAA
jgi:predicted enzyme related to lactoylglutathione lyase